MNLIQRYQADERRIFTENSGTQEVKISKVPPPPVVMCRTDTFMVFKPAPFVSSANEKVSNNNMNIDNEKVNFNNMNIDKYDNYFSQTISSQIHVGIIGVFINLFHLV